MLTLLKRVHEVLTGSTPLVTKLGGSAQIGTNLRKKPDQPAIEYGFDTGSIESGNKEIQSLRVSVYGTTSHEDTLEIAELVTDLLTPKALSSVTLNLHCGMCSKTRNTVLPSTDFNHQIDMTFRVLFTATPSSH